MFNWTATLSDGTIVVEHSGKYKIVPGERKPWVRLTEDLTEQKLFLTSLSLNINGRTIHLPSSSFDRFGLNDVSRAPSFYSLQYIVEGEMANGGPLTQSEFIDLIAHYEGFEVHYIQDTKDGNISWINVTSGTTALAPTPSR